MAFTVTSLDNIVVTLPDTSADMSLRDIASKLKKFGSLSTGPIHCHDLVAISQWLSHLHKAPWEVGLVQNRLTKALRLLNGEASRSFRIGAMVGETYLRRDDIFIVHVHPIMSSKPGHVDADRKSATEAIEGVVDWSGKLLCYNKAKFFNESDRRSPAASLQDARNAVKRGSIPFLDSRGMITGYRHFDKETHKPTFINPFETLI